MQKKLLLWLSLYILSMPLAYAGAWVQKQDSWLVIIRNEWYSSSHYWDQQSVRRKGGDYRKWELNPYIEYGLTKKLTFGLSPFFRQAYSDGNKAGFDLGDIQMLGRYAIWQSDYSSFSNQLRFNIPLQSLNGSQQVYQPLSEGQYWLEERLLYGTGGQFAGFYRSFWYINVESAYQMKFSGAADALHLDVSMGWKSPGQIWRITIKLLNQWSLRNQRERYDLDYDLHSIEPSISYALTQSISFEVGFKHDVYGRNVGQGNAIFLSSWLHW